MGDSTKRRAASGNDSAGRKKSRVSQRMPKHLLLGGATSSLFMTTRCYKVIDRFADQYVMHEAMENAQERPLICACKH